MTDNNNSNGPETGIKKEPPEDTYAWVIMISCFFLIFLGSLSTLSFAIMVIELADVFQRPLMELNIIQSLQFFFCCTIGIVSSPFVNEYGPRKLALIGTGLLSLGLFTSAFATSVPYLYITLGIITGIGQGNIWLIALSGSLPWFNKRRPLAAGVVIAGQILAFLVSAPLTTSLIEMYGWRGSLIMLSGISFHLFVFSSLLRRPPDNSLEEKCHKSIPGVLKETFDLTLLRNTHFLLFFIGIILLNYGMGVIRQDLPGRLFHSGYTLEQGSLSLVFVFGACLVLGIPCSLLATTGPFTRFLMYLLGCSIGGVVMLISVVTNQLIPVLVFSTMYGISMISFLSVQQVLMVDILGINLVVRAQAFVLIGIGIGSSLGLIVSGRLVDITNNYMLSFIVASSAQILSGIIILPIFGVFKEKAPENIHLTAT